jgi:(+)-trans-carveol dehydrogenase
LGLVQKGNYMAGRVQGKVALVTGAARGQGRAHALRLASEGADIIAIDNCSDVDTIPYGGATSDELKETAAGVKASGRRIVTHEIDVREPSPTSWAHT